MQLPKLTDLDVMGKRVLIRGDLDVSPEKAKSNFRIKSLIPTLEYLISKKARIILVGHRGRPHGKIDGKLSFREMSKVFNELLGIERKFVYDITGMEAQDTVNKLSEGQILVLENLRFDTREEENREDFAKVLAGYADFFVNEAFAASHDKHSSIVGVAKLLPHAAGLHFVKEVKNLETILKNPKKPVVVLISGVKDNKLKYIEEFKKIADKVLLAGRLPDYIHDDSPFRKDKKIIVGKLVADKEDISLHSVEEFENEIANAGTIVVSGPIGKFEDEGHSQGTKRVFGAVAKSRAFKVAGGGDTEVALNKLGLEDKFNWISVGGGAMLEFLTKGTLPGIKVLIE